MKKSFVFEKNVVATGDMRLDNTTLKNLWKGFCLTACTLEIKEGVLNTFVIGNCEIPTLASDKEFAFSVTDTGVAVIGQDYNTLVRGVIALMLKIEYVNGKFEINACNAQSNYLLKNRMIHICVFPENDLHYIKKLIRLIAVCQYTHVVIEFWGMLKYDCLKELAWDNAFTKQEAAEIIKETRDLGVQPIPMFNQLGHASACRVAYGKHVVLDQNPLLQPLFTPDGWAWDIDNEEVCKLLKTIREELYELFGDGEYMHIGCDEAYFYTFDDERRKTMPAFLNKLTTDVVNEGRRPMLWMDMLLEKNKYEKCTATCNPEDVDVLTKSLHPDTVMVDWQYKVDTAPVPTLDFLKDSDYDVVGAPWLDENNYVAHIDTIADYNLFGIMLTTWHTLNKQMPGVVGCAKKLGMATFDWSLDARHTLYSETATLLRRVSFEGNSYEECGWARKQIQVDVVH